MIAISNRNMDMADTEVVIIMKVIIKIGTGHKNWSVVGYVIKSDKTRIIGIIDTIVNMVTGNIIVKLIKIEVAD